VTGKFLYLHTDLTCKIAEPIKEERRSGLDDKNVKRGSPFDGHETVQELVETTSDKNPERIIENTVMSLLRNERQFSCGKHCGEKQNYFPSANNYVSEWSGLFHFFFDSAEISDKT
jgi:hypothetical protein